MKVTQISIGRFHHFHAARELESRGLLREIWTGYPKFKLKDEHGIPQHKIRTFPWLQLPYLAKGKLPCRISDKLTADWAWLAHQTLDRHVAKKIAGPGLLFALSGSGLHAGRRMQAIGGKYICDRGSSHIEHQNGVLHEEYARHGLKCRGVDPRSIRKELAEYEQADKITVPTEFVKRTFITKGVDPSKIQGLPYGANLIRFQKVDCPAPDTFRVIWVGQASIRKGFFDALAAFKLLRHPHKQFVVIGGVQPEITQLLKSRPAEDHVDFLGAFPNAELPRHLSSSHVFILPSLEEGMALVQGEALACGCPVIATPNTGSEDLFTDGVEGYIVPIRNPSAMAERLQQLADDPELRRVMSENAIRRVTQLGGWNTYGDKLARLITELSGKSPD